MQPTYFLLCVLPVCCCAVRIHSADVVLQNLTQESERFPASLEQKVCRCSVKRARAWRESNRCACAGDSLKTLRTLLLARYLGTAPRYARTFINAATHRRGMTLAQEQVSVDTTLDDEKIRNLYAWLLQAFDGDERYNNLQYAFAAVFGNPAPAFLRELVIEAVDKLPGEDEPTGSVESLANRERNSLGAMGAGQWLGRYRTRPHSLLDVRPYNSIEEWTKGLKKNQRKTLAKALAQNFTVTSKIVEGDRPAPHSSLAHFRCIVEHEVRLLNYSPESFLNAINQAIGRYTNCISQTGDIHEYRDEDGRLIAFAHEVRKGRVIRGQWFYATDAASKRYVWFHSVRELARRAIEADMVEFADLGPSGSEDFEALKSKYGFSLYEDWHLVANYSGAFRYGDQGEDWFRDMWQKVQENLR